jgi:hypothetical protein
MNDHSAERHVFTTLKTRPSVYSKAVPQQLRPQGMSTSRAQIPTDELIVGAEDGDGRGRSHGQEKLGDVQRRRFR